MVIHEWLLYRFANCFISRKVNSDSLVNSTAQVTERLEKILGSKTPFYNVDCVSEEALRQVFDKEGNIAGAIHFAAYKAVGESVEKPLMY